MPYGSTDDLQDYAKALGFERKKVKKLEGELERYKNATENPPSTSLLAEEIAELRKENRMLLRAVNVAEENLQSIYVHTDCEKAKNKANSALHQINSILNP